MAPRLHPVWNLVVAAAFLATILLPGAVMLAGVDHEAARGENRSLAPRPQTAFTWTSLRALPGAASRYFEDHFGLRARLVRWQAALRLEVFHVSASPDVIVGKDGWLFYAGDGGIEDITSAVPFTPDELELWRTTLQHTQDWLAARGIAYAFVLAPDKHAVYPEYLPETIRRMRAETRTDVLVRYLREHSSVHVVDARSDLMAAKARERLFQRTDTHWNERGAFVEYDAIMRALGPSVAGAPAMRGSFEAPERRIPGMDVAGMLGLTDRIEEVDLPLVPKGPRRARVVEPAPFDTHFMEARLVTEQDDLALPRAVVFRDSFGSALVPFLAEHFSRALFLWQYNMDPDVVVFERPAVVIQEWVGRRLSTELPYNPFGGGASSIGEARR